MKIVHITSAHSRNSTRIFHKMALSSVDFGHDVSLVVADGKKNNLKNLPNNEGFISIYLINKNFLFYQLILLNLIMKYLKDILK